MVIQNAFSKSELYNLLPQGEPIHLVDKAVISSDEKSIETELFLLPAMDIFKGHFKNQPILPGVYILEHMAQSCGVLLLANPAFKDKLPLLTSVSQVRFLNAALPGQTLYTHCELLLDAGNNIFDFKVTTKTSSSRIATGKITLAMK